MEYSPTKMQKKLNEKQFNFKKNFGQNFIVDENIINSIVNKSGVNEDTLVIEIGPGAGSLTYKLCEKAKNVLCYEIDIKLKPILEENLKNYSNYEVIYQDFLKVNINENLKKYEYKKLYVVANLPYYITTPIIMKIIEDNINVDKIVVMVQKEVGDRFKAQPGSKDYSSLSIFLQYYFEISKIMDVSKHVFLPKPNVDSIVVEFKKKESLLKLEDNMLFFNLIRDSFKQKRKTLRNNLKGYNLEKVEEILKKHNMDLSVRAEQISLQLFVEIANHLK
ncbi:MAG: 16S rRNA (adenine(1518)-N(6)/adenine(1519)-N(6))-dimethyltransferase RsmA [Firmicutes bacterium]|nr:16S rRNA (adenine(1518)-N(6)/adenine(1519)-N(6))-dimethyltransferase RsmA [Bacillota bacterium]